MKIFYGIEGRATKLQTHLCLVDTVHTNVQIIGLLMVLLWISIGWFTLCTQKAFNRTLLLMGAGLIMARGLAGPRFASSWHGFARDNSATLPQFREICAATPKYGEVPRSIKAEQHATLCTKMGLLMAFFGADPKSELDTSKSNPNTQT